VVVTIHDVSYMEHPEYLPASRAWQLRLSTRHTLRHAARVITISEFSRQHVSRAFDLDPDRIAVTPLAAQDNFRVMNRDLAAHLVSERLGIAGPYVLHVGDLHPRKNQVGLIRAFGELLAEHPELPHKLVLAGKHTWHAPKVIEQVRRSGLEQRVVLMGFVEDEILPALYNAADLFVFPSFYEGFGLPLVEAMACGRPIACSTATALPEVVDGAGIFFDPHSTAELVRALRDVLLDGELARRMERKSLQRAASFDWRETARKTLDVYYEVAESRERMRRTKELVTR
jgi:glycosyltransferase involved in cell wall biosynthesis